MPIAEDWLRANLREESNRLVLRQVVEGDEALDADAFGRVLTEDAAFRFGNVPATNGKSAIVEVVRAFLSTLKAFRHDILVCLEGPDLLAWEAVVTYRRGDDRIVSIPYANVLRTRGALVYDYRIYIDIAPLYAA